MRKSNTVEANLLNADFDSHSGVNIDTRRREAVLQPKKAALLGTQDKIMRKKLTKFESFDIEYDQGVAGISKLNVVGRLLDGDKGPEGLTLRHGINLILTVQKEQIPIVQVY